MLPTIRHTLHALPCSMLKDQPFVLRQHSRVTCALVYEGTAKDKDKYSGR